MFSKITLFPATIVAIFLMILFLILIRKEKFRKPAIYILLTISLCFSLFDLSLITIGAKRGMLYNPKWKQMTITQIMKTNVKTPPASYPKDNEKGVIAIVYKYGCPDCDIVYKTIAKDYDKNSKIYFVPSRSPLGKELVNEGNITSVPTGVYIRKKPLSNGAKYNNIDLITMKEGELVLNKNAYDRLLTLYKSKA